MGVLDKLLDAVKLNDDYDDDYLEDEEDYLDDYEEDEEDYLDEKPRKSIFSKFTERARKSDDFEDEEDFEEPVRSKAKAKNGKPEKKESDTEKNSRFSFRTSDTVKETEKAEKQVRTSPKITPMRNTKKSAGPSTMEVCVIKPTSMEDTREIADTLLDNSTVILNLEGIDVELAQRITDFSSGACYALGGRLQKISSYIFVMAPYNVDITGDLQNVLGGSIPSVRAGY